jgi:hypothetical protein
MPPFVLLLAAFLAAEPLLHTHPLQNTAAGTARSSACAVCATGVVQLPILIAAVAAPHVVIDVLSVPTAIFVAAPISLFLASRAPPVA